MIWVVAVQRAPRSKRLALMREYMDSISKTQDYHATFTPVERHNET